MIPSYRHTPTFLTKGCEVFPSTNANRLSDLHVIFFAQCRPESRYLARDLFEVDTRTPGSMSHVHCFSPVGPARAGALLGGRGEGGESD